MRSRLMLFCLLAGCSAAEQRADSQLLDPSPLIPSILSPADQLAYANTKTYGANIQRDLGYNLGNVGSYSSESLLNRRSDSKNDGYGWNQNPENIRRSDRKGLYAYGYDGGHKSAKGYSDSLPKEYPYQIVGRHAFSFQHRYIRASGLMMPITPEALEPLGYREKKEDVVFVPPY